MSAIRSASTDTELVYVHRSHHPKAWPEFSAVTLLVAASTIEDGRRVEAGTIGTIVVVHDEGLAYDVEFADPPGTVAALATNLVPV